MNRSAAVVVFILVAPLVVLGIGLQMRPPRPPVLLVTLEAVTNSQHLSSLDALGARSLRFTDALAPADALSLLDRPDRPAMLALPAWMKAQGYFTGAVSPQPPDLQAYPAGKAYVTLGEGFDDYLGGRVLPLVQTWMGRHHGAWFLWVDLAQDEDRTLGQLLGMTPPGSLLIVCGLGSSQPVPLLICWPGHLAPRQISQRVSVADVYPTLAHLLHRNPPRGDVGEDLSADTLR
ncbi:MAG: alkaline phosphatase family protein [Candidatus Xenobia bacterium]